ncbi:MAG: HD domain-containing protein [Patescibacteria group bacterium]
MAEGFFKKLDASGLYEAGKELVKRACCFAANAHYGQKRFSGEDFIFHLLAVAELLLDIGQSAVVIAAGVLHDTVEDTRVTIAEIRQYFGPEVAFLVDGMTKVGDQDTVYRAKLIAAAEKDYRVVLVRLADRIHNMRTLEFLPARKRQSVAEETLEFHIPLAKKFIPAEELEKISLWPEELKSLSRKYVQPTLSFSLDRGSTAPCLSAI